jgi:hypothetical protein
VLPSASPYTSADFSDRSAHVAPDAWTDEIPYQSHGFTNSTSYSEADGLAHKQSIRPSKQRTDTKTVSIANCPPNLHTY